MEQRLRGSPQTSPVCAVLSTPGAPVALATPGWAPLGGGGMAGMGFVACGNAYSAYSRV